MAEAQALGAARLAECSPGADVVDVPCGYGRHSIPLARAGYRVVGVDRSRVLLAEARRRAGDAEWPRFVEADYRAIPLADETFDLALNLFSSLGYLGDEGDVGVLREIRRVLRPRGRLVVEAIHRDRLVRIFDPRSSQTYPDGTVFEQVRSFDPAAGLVEETQTLVAPDGARESRSYRLRVYSATELLAMLAEAGFAARALYGDLDGNPFTLDTRLAVVAERPAR